MSSINYFPFGSTRSGSVSTDRKFTGQRLDGTGLYYYGARYYDAEIGRFISADTIVPNLANPQSLNRYSYCLNNPLKYVDPSGHGVKVRMEKPPRPSPPPPPPEPNRYPETTFSAEPSWSGWITAYTMDTGVELESMPVASLWGWLGILENILSASGTLELPVTSSHYSVWTSTNSTQHGTYLDVYMQVEGEDIGFRRPFFHGTLDPSPEAKERYIDYATPSLFPEGPSMVPLGYYQFNRKIEMSQVSGPLGTQCFQGSIYISPKDVVPLSVDLKFYYVYDSYSRRIWLDPREVSISLETE